MLATEFAHQKADFRRKFFEELVPTVTRDPPGRARHAVLSLYRNLGEPTGNCPCGTWSNPVSLHVKWEKNPGSALRRLYAISQQPDCVNTVNELWRQAWPQALWSDLLSDGMLDHVDTWESPLHVNIEFLISSDEPLQLPWDWLALNLLYAPAAGFRHWLYVNAPQLQETPPTYFYPHYRQHYMSIHVGLHRPAHADQFQLIMYKTLCGTNDFWSSDEDADDACSIVSIVDYWPDLPTDVIYVKPTCMQKVAITGSWCQLLPKACEDLWRVHAGCHVRGMTLGDDIAIALRELVDPFTHCVEVDINNCLLEIAPAKLKPFTCEVADQSDWKQKRQQAKQREKIKKVKIAGQGGTRRMSKTHQARLIRQDISEC